MILSLPSLSAVSDNYHYLLLQLLKDLQRLSFELSLDLQHSNLERILSKAVLCVELNSPPFVVLFWLRQAVELARQKEIREELEFAVAEFESWFVERTDVVTFH